MVRSLWPRLIAVAAFVAVAITIMYALVKPLIHAESGVYEMPRDAIAGVFVASFLAAVGAALISSRYRTRVAALSAVATFLLLFGLITILSVGVLVLPFALLAFAATALAMRGYDARAAGWSAASGSLLSLGLIVVLLAFIQPPVVRCLPGEGVASSSHYWWGGGPSRGSASGSSSTAEGGSQITGTIKRDTETITFTCRNGS